MISDTHRIKLHCIGTHVTYVQRISLGLDYMRIL